MPSNVSHARPTGGIPHHQLPAVAQARARGQAGAIGTPGQTPEGGVGVVEVADDLQRAPGGTVPEPDGILPAGTGQHAAIGTPPYATHAPGMAVQQLWRPSPSEVFYLPEND